MDNISECKNVVHLTNDKVQMKNYAYTEEALREANRALAAEVILDQAVS